LDKTLQEAHIQGTSSTLLDLLFVLTVQGTANFLTLISAFCKMLDNLPHDQAFSQLIVRQMETYARKCTSWYQALVSRGSPTATGRKLRAPAAWAESAEMEDLVNQIFQTNPKDAINFNTLIEQESSLLLPTIEKEPLDQGDIIKDKKTLTNLCLLFTSMKWLSTKIARLRHISDRATDSTRIEPGSQRHNRRWTLLSSSEPRTEGTPVYLPLDQATAA
jgi:exocyst complex component 4